MADDYDIGKAFQAIEDELISSMIRNLKRHRAEEEKLGYNWSMWQVEQLKSLEKYKKENQAKYPGKFKNINQRIRGLLTIARSEGSMSQEITILNAIKNGFPAKRVSKGAAAKFFRLNNQKLEALIKATTDDMERAEIAVLRRVEDQYRQVIYNAQVYANTGAGTYEKAVDMATRDFLRRGIDCIEYSNGSRHTIADYADMAIRTASKRAYLQGEGQKRQEWGVCTVIVNKRGNPCPKCLPHCGKVYIDDVWSGGPKDGKSPVTGITYPLISTAIEGGLYHPRCKDSHTTYFEGISTPPSGSKYTRDELDQLADRYAAEQKQQYARRQEEKYDRMAKYSLDPDNRKKYNARAAEWSELTGKKADKKPVTKKSVSAESNSIRDEINEMRAEKKQIQKTLKDLEKQRKELELKALLGDASEMESSFEQAKTINASVKEIEQNIKDMENRILEKQSLYKTSAEKRLLESGTVKEIKLSKKMSPDAVDALEETLYHLKEKYGIMPERIVFSPFKIPDGTASYNWIDDTIYLSNRFNDPEEYLDTVRKAEESFSGYRKHYKIAEKAKENIEKADAVLNDKSIKGYEREKARILKAESEIKLNTSRQAVREDMSDVLIHEYGHFIHRHANIDYVQKKNVYRMKDLGGSMISGDWVFDLNKKYSAHGKIEASKISEYATKDPYEAFAEGFLAMEKGETIPESIADVITEAMKRSGAKK